MVRRYQSGMTLSFPPFTHAVKWLVIANAAVYLLLTIAGGVAPSIAQVIPPALGLVPTLVVHGFVWQVITYSFLHAGLFHLLFNMLSLWMFGSTIESSWGSRRFVEFYFGCVLAAALATIAITYTGLGLQGVFPDVPLLRSLAQQTQVVTVGASGGVYGILMAFGIIFAEQEIFMFPFPFSIKAKYMVGILIFIAIVGAIGDVGGMANLAHLGGLLFGYLYVRHAPARSLTGRGFSPWGDLRNRYYRWKRRRAARKFEVYMRKQDGDPKTQFFDEYGNYRGPGAAPRTREDDERAEGEGRKPWIH